ncbi:MAG: HAD family phosphatase [Solobacterium sp.]|nr:HAD family phosphatase [Solobacterium sp.]
MLKGAIFDMDGILFDTESIWQRNWEAMAKERGIDLPLQFRYDICGSAGEKLLNIVRKYYHTDEPEKIYEEVVLRGKKELEKGTPVMKGVEEILSFFQENNVAIAVASSSPYEQIQHNLESTGLRKYFSVLASGQQLKVSKPDPAIFLHAAKLLGLDAKECYVFEDALNGIKAGYASGACTIMIPDTMPPTEEMYSLCKGVYPSLFDAKEAIEKGEL